MSINTSRNSWVESSDTSTACIVSYGKLNYLKIFPLNLATGEILDYGWDYLFCRDIADL